MIKENIKLFFQILIFKKNTGLSRNDEIMFGISIWCSLISMTIQIINIIIR
jgi:hypothetical protein